MRTVILFLTAWLLLCWQADAQQLTAAEYFLDSDPGVGNATPVPVNTGDVATASFSVPGNGIPEGFHTLSTRFKDANGTWGIAASRLFYVYGSVTGSSDPAPPIAAGEYFIDADPGTGAATPFSVAQNDQVTAAFSVDGTGLLEGFHTMSVRLKNTEGTWGIAASRLFYVYGGNGGGVNPAAPIAAGEYFIDTDPGTGAATAFSVAQNDQVTAAFSVDGTGLLEGFHTMSVRLKDTEGTWGIAASRLFYVYGGNGGGVNPAAPIAAAEYFFDVDPGTGNGTALPTGTPQNTVSLNTVIDASALPMGTHVLNIRFKDTEGHWGIAEARPFIVLPPGALANDECLGATVLPLQAYGNCPASGMVGSTEEATISSATDCWGGSYPDVWYQVNSGSSPSITINLTAVGAQDLRAEVYDGCGGSLLACMSSFPYDYGTTPNTNYWVRVFAATTAGGFSICASGAMEDCLGVVGGPAMPGTACDDGNANTHSDSYQANCTCQGWDCEGVLGGTTGPGTACLVTNDPTGAPFYGAYDANCSCIWTDCDNVANGSNYPGQACDDGNAGTYNDAFDINCTCHGYDCAGVYNGTATLDNCGACVGGTTGQTACVADCHGDFGGTATIDNCGTCVGGNTGLIACVQDCHGDFGGTASLDNCGVCAGGNTGVAACVQDCSGEWGGTAHMDNCATCVGGNTGLTACVQDCNGQWGGTAYMDNCSTCVGGTTGLQPCAQDCNGDLGGTAYVDNCGTCVGGNTGQLPCVADCHGDFGGTASIDVCNVCAGGNTGVVPNSSCTDCAGVPNGLSRPDSCGTCLLPSDPAFQTAVRTLSFTGTGNFQSALLFPQTGEPSSTYTAEVIYTNSANGQLPLGYPRLILDYEGDGIFNGPFDRTVLMVATDASDVTTHDGKRYRCTVLGLPTGTDYQTLVQTAEGQCVTQIGPFNYPDVLVAPDLEIFASDIHFNNPNPAINSPLTVFARVHNRSDFAAEGFAVHLVNEFEPGTVYPDITIPWLAPHDTLTVSWNITTPNVVAWCPMHVTVDANNVIAETNELNNNAIRPFVNGAFNVPGAIHVYASVDPAVSVISPLGSTVGLTVSGHAYYSGTAVVLADSSVAGSTVTLHGHYGETLTGITDANGFFSISYVTSMGVPGTFSVTGEVTDYTITGALTANYTLVSGVTPPCEEGYSVGVQLNEHINGYLGNAVLAGESVSGTITVYNYGCEDVDVPTVLDIGQTGGLPEIGDVMVPPLASGESYTLPFSNIVFSTPGYYTICGTSDADNVLGDPAYHSSYCTGLMVFPALPDITPEGGGIGNTFLCLVGEPSFGLRNLGAVPTGPFNCSVDVYRDGNFDGSFVHAVGNIEAFSTTGFTIPYTPPAVGDYTFVIACDVPLPNGSVVELNESNNSATYQGSLIACQADLSVNFPCEAPVTPDDPAPPGMVTYHAIVGNTGNASAQGPIEVRFDVSSGGSYTAQYPGDLAPGETVAIQVEAPAVPSATASLTAVVDPQNTVPEFSEGGSTTGNLCHEYAPVVCGGWGWPQYPLLGHTTAVSVVLASSGLYTASQVKVRFEVSGPDIVGTALLGDVLVDPAEARCYCGVGVALPGSFLFSSVGTYHFTFTVDPDNAYAECNEGNNVLTRDVVITNLPDLRVLSQYINPSLLNPDVNQPVTLDVTYENIGYGNLGSTFALKVMANNDELATVANLPGLVTGGTHTVSIPVPFSSGIVGLHVFRAIIDANNEVAEGDEMNNEATRSIVVGAASNLYFQAFTVSTQTPSIGQLVTLQAIVGNNGDLPNSGDVVFFYVTAAGDTLPIGNAHPVAVDSAGTMSVGASWTATVQPTALVARIQNSAFLEFTYTDNEAHVAMGAITAQLTATPGCPGGPVGTLTANVVGGMAPYLYVWSNDSTGMVLHAEPGPFSVTITDAEGRTTTASGLIPVDSNCGTTDCNGDVGGTASLDNCGVCSGGNTGVTPCAADCHGDFGGTAYTDNCNTCVGGNTGLTACVQDCHGQWGGTAYVDNCATCVGGTTGLNPCAADCHGDFGGTAYTDNCNTCVGGTTGLTACTQDCHGQWGGTAYVDNCATCVGGTTGLTPCAADCHGDFGGTAYTDNCNTCVGGNTGLTACVQDCHGQWGGTAYVDNCATCVGGTTGLNPCAADCHGDFGGTAYTDNCNTCVGGNTGLTACVQDCHGQWGGTAYVDNCATCVGGTTGLNPCTADCHGDFGGTAYTDNCNTCVGGNTGLNPCTQDCQGTWGGTHTAGTACNDGNPNTINDVYNASCVCIGTPIAGPCNGNKVVMNITTDGNPAQLTWVFTNSANAVVATGTLASNQNNATVSETVCLNLNAGAECYGFKLMDSFGDGITNGGWELRTTGGKVVLRDGFSSGSQSPASTPATASYGGAHSFCLPLGPVDILANECGIFNNALGNKVYCNKPAGATQYEFEFSDPDAGFLRRVTVNRNYVIFSELGSNITPGVKYFARVRTNVAGPLASAHWGSGCEMGLGVAQVVTCSELITAPAYGHSCNESRAFNTNNSFIYAKPVNGANEYQFRIYNLNEGYDQTFTRSTYILQLKWNSSVAPPLVNGSTYSVEINTKVNGVYSGFCPSSCTISINNALTIEQASAFGEATLWPNPVSDGQVNLSIGGLQDADQRISVDVQDLYGKQVFAQAFSNSGDRFNTILQLPGDIASGVYVVNITVNGQRTVQRLSIVK